MFPIALTPDRVLCSVFVNVFPAVSIFAEKNISEESVHHVHLSVCCILCNMSTGHSFQQFNYNGY